MRTKQGMHRSRAGRGGWGRRLRGAAVGWMALVCLVAGARGYGQNVIHLPESAKAPVVDGVISEGEYADAIKLPNSFMRLMSFRAVNPMAGVYLARHGQRLYICWISPLREGEYPLSQCFTPDYTKICTDPSVSFFLHPPRGPAEDLSYYHFIGNARGTYYDANVNKTIGQTFTYWDADIEYENIVSVGDRWVAELSVALTDFGFEPAEIGDGLEFGMELARDGGFAPQCYSMAFHNTGKYTRIHFDNDAPLVRVDDFGDFTQPKVRPKVTVSSETAMRVKATFGVMKETVEKTAEIAAGGSATLEAELTVPEVKKGNALLRLADGDGKVFFERTWPFEPKGYEFTPVEEAERKPLTLSAYWAPTFGKVHVLADIYELGRGPDQATRVDVAVLDPEGRQLGASTIADFSYGGGRVDVDLGQSLPEGEYAVKGTARTPLGEVLAESSITYDRKRYDWEGSTLGISDDVIKPWTPIETDGARVSVWGRTYRLGAYGLPESIESLQPEPTRGHEILEMLAAPARLVVERDGRPVAMTASPPQLLEASRTEARYGAAAVSDKLNYSMVGRMVYDGFYRIDMRLAPVEQANVDSVRVEVPLRGEMARLLFAVGEDKRKNNSALALADKDGVLWDSASTARNSIVMGNFLPYVWVGDEDRGLAWMANNDRSWILDHAKPCLDVVRKGDRAILRIHLINKPASLTRPVTASFSLQATPVRPRPRGGSWREAINFEWDFFGPGRGGRPLAGAFPDAEERANIAELAEQHRKRSRVFPYQNVIVGDKRQQAYRDFLGEWMVVPGYGSRTQVKSHTDWCLDCFQWWIEDLPTDGLYFDCVFPAPNMNTLNGIGWIDEKGRRRAGYDMFEDRAFFRRVATYLRSQPQCKDTVVNIFMHMTDNANASQLGWAGFWLAGESSGRVKRAGVENPDAVDRWGHDPGLARLRAHALGRQYGAIPAWLYRYNRFGTVYGLHDIPRGMGDGVYRHPLGGEVQNTIDMRSEDLEFIPYWHIHPWYTVRAGGRVKCSAWRLGEVVRVQVSNLNHENVHADLQFDLDFLGLPADCEISRQTDGKVIPHTDGRIEALPLGYHEFEVLMLAPKGKLDTGGAEREVKALNTGASLPAFRESFDGLDLDTKVWTIACGHGSADVNIDPYYGTLRIRSIKGDYATASRDFGKDNVSVRVKMYRPDGNRPQVAGAALYWGKAEYVQGGVFNPRKEERKQAIRFSASKGKEKLFRGPEAAWSNWVRFDLTPGAVELYASVDGKAWTKTGSVPRGGDRFAGAPSHLILGFGHETEKSENELLRNSRRIYRLGQVEGYFDEIVVEALPATK